MTRRARQKGRSVVGIGVGFLLLAMTGCWSVDASWVYTAEPIEGRVIDKETGQPIEGVVVLAQWILQKPIEGHKAEHWVVIEAVTDSEGKYKIPGWGPKWRPWFRWLENADPVLDVFKPGYWTKGFYNYYPGTFQTINPKSARVRKSAWNGKIIEMWPFKIGVELEKQFDVSEGHPYPLEHVITEKEWVDQLTSMQLNVDWGGFKPRWTADDWLKIKNLVQVIERECSKLSPNQRVRLDRLPQEFKPILFGENNPTCL